MKVNEFSHSGAIGGTQAAEANVSSELEEAAIARELPTLLPGRVLSAEWDTRARTLEVKLRHTGGRYAIEGAREVEAILQSRGLEGTNVRFFYPNGTGHLAAPDTLELLPLPEERVPGQLGTALKAQFPEAGVFAATRQGNKITLYVDGHVAADNIYSDRNGVRAYLSQFAGSSVSLIFDKNGVSGSTIFDV